MRATAPHSARADRPPRPDPPGQLRSHPHEPRGRMPPRRQPLPALRAGQPARNQLAFDHDRIKTYAEQRTASGRVRTALPGSRPTRAGRAVGFQDRPEPIQAVLTLTRPATPTHVARNVLTVDDAEDPHPPQPGR